MKRTNFNWKRIAVMSFLAVVVVLVVSVVLAPYIIRILNETAVDMKCVEGKKPVGNYIRGEIVVVFNDTDTINKAAVFLKQNGLDINNCYNLRCSITVPDGNEAKWMCIMEESGFVSSTFFNYMTHPAG